MNLRRIFILTSLMSTFGAYAGQIVTNVASVVDSSRLDRILVLSSVDGRVYKAEREKEYKKYLESLKDQNVSITFSESGTERTITTITPVGSVSEDLNMFEHNPNRDFVPTDVGTVEKATELFNSLDQTNKDRSQCFKRAHMWSYDLWSRLGINTSKQFIFYTTRFMELENFDWWFHVAPSLKVAGVDYVIDGGFTFIDKPYKTKDWQAKVSPGLKNITCPVIDHYDQYDNNRWGRLCYLRLMPMHYFRPADIRDLDRKGITKTGWELEELQDARRAFKNGDETYEALDTGNKTITH